MECSNVIFRNINKKMIPIFAIFSFFSSRTAIAGIIIGLLLFFFHFVVKIFVMTI